MVRINNRKFSIPVLGGEGLPNVYMTEPWMIKILEQICPKSSGHFIDVGVNIGQTLLKLKSVDANKPYIGFEPNPACVSYVQKLIQTNQFSNCDLIPVGIHKNAEIGVLHFYTDATDDSSASMISNYRSAQSIKRKMYIPLMNLPEIEKTIEIQDISILKIDVEGGEWEVLQTLEPWLSRFQPFILIEILPVYQADNGIRLERQNQILDLFQRHSYHIFRVIKQNNEFISLRSLSTIEIHGDTNLCEYVICHQTKVNQLSELLEK